jgi:hypothetical protein
LFGVLSEPEDGSCPVQFEVLVAVTTKSVVFWVLREIEGSKEYIASFFRDLK